MWQWLGKQSTNASVATYEGLCCYEGWHQKLWKKGNDQGWHPDDAMKGGIQIAMNQPINQCNAEMQWSVTMKGGAAMKGENKKVEKKETIKGVIWMQWWSGQLLKRKKKTINQSRKKETIKGGMKEVIAKQGKNQPM